MLAVDAEDLELLHYPLLASFKMDGIRIVTCDDGPKTRSLKNVPNKYVRSWLELLPSGIDGEVGVIENGVINFRATTSAIMSFAGEPDINYFVFDKWNLPLSYDERYKKLQLTNLPDWCVLVEQILVHNAEEVRALFARALDEGHEGLILRRGDALYKFGRSTLNEAGLLKVKPWKDAEAKIIAVLPEFENTNEKEKNELGLSKRSSKKAGMIQKERMGKFLVESPLWPKPFEIGTGFTHADRLAFWWDRENLLGKLVRFGYVDAGGYDVPRHCVFQGFRDERDL